MAAAILALALGIGANTAIFSVVNSILLNPAALRNLQDPGRLVMIWESLPGMSPEFADHMPVAAANILEWRQQARSFESLTAFQPYKCNLGADHGDRPDRVDALTVEPGFFHTLGIRPALGRGFTPDEARNSVDRVVMVSDEIWRTRLGGGREVSGKTIRVNGVDRTIVGVLPAGFQIPVGSTDEASPKILTPVVLSTQKEEQQKWGLTWAVYGRLKPGVAPSQAAGEANVLFSRLKKAQPDENVGGGVNVIPLASENTGSDVRSSVLMLQVAVAFVLLIACANVANLLLARAVGRQRELSIRLALGAGRARIARLLLAESLLLSVAGAALGLALAWWGLDAIGSLAPKDSHGFHDLKVDRLALAFTFLVALATAFISGLAPAMHAVRQNLNESLSQGGRAIGSGPKWLRSGLVVGEVALALVLLAGAGLMIRSLSAMMGVELGYRTDHLLTTRVSVADPGVAASPEKLKAFCNAILDGVERLPGVVSASISNALPMADFTEANYSLEGEPKTKELHVASQSRVSEGFFTTLGMPIRRGRNFTRAEAEAVKPGVVIVSESFARKNWPGQDALGKIVIVDKPLIVVGITADTHQMGPDHEPIPALFIPARSYETFDLAIHTAGDPLAVKPAVERTIWRIDPQQPVQEMLSMQRRLREWGDERRFYMAIMAIFASLALVLATLGLYGVLAYVVSLRTREVGIRMALGATAPDVLKLVLGQGLRMTLAGVVVGAAGALFLTRLMQSMVFGISPSDPASFVVASASLFFAALLATYLPARRAAKVDPMQALRTE